MYDASSHEFTDQLSFFPTAIGPWGRLFGNRFYLKNPNVRLAFVQLLVIPARIGDGRTFPFRHHILTDTVFRMVFPGAVQLYESASCTGTAHQYFDALNIRQVCLDLFSIWFEYPKPCQYFKENLEVVAIARFVTSLVSDCLAAVVPMLKAIGKGAEAKSNRRAIEDAHTYVKLLDTIARDPPGAFIRPQVPRGVADLLLHVCRQMITVPLSVLPYAWEQTGSRILLCDFLKCLLRLGPAAASGAEALEFLAMEPPETFEHILTFLHSQSPPQNPAEWSDACDGFAGWIEAIGNAIPEPEDIPSEFEDPICANLIMDPVKITIKTGVPVFLDRSTVDRLTPSQRRLPNGAPFRLEDVVVDEDCVALKRRINEWLEAWREQWRRGNRGK
jgi:hypothetical protein